MIENTYDKVVYFSEYLSCVKKDGKWGLFGKTKEITPCIYDEISPLYKGFAYVKKNDKYGFIDSNGKEITECVYDMVWPFYNGRACVEKDGKYGYINKLGKEIIPIIYDKATNFGYGYALVSKNNEFGYIDKAGKEYFDETEKEDLQKYLRFQKTIKKEDIEKE